ncbi:hypothetical protein AB0M23_31035, partial [Streptomyces sp. NPDC052077]|uniref:hypothetical protein n=1 Tax=Streptomyces sp. NPDC052077 TaxID=3154757 RepID=UPI00342B2364
ARRRLHLTPPPTPTHRKAPMTTAPPAQPCTDPRHTGRIRAQLGCTGPDPTDATAHVVDYAAPTGAPECVDDCPGCGATDPAEASATFEGEPLRPDQHPATASPAQFVWLWNQATPAERLDRAQRIIDLGNLAETCVLENHRSRLADAGAEVASLQVRFDTAIRGFNASALEIHDLRARIATLEQPTRPRVLTDDEYSNAYGAAISALGARSHNPGREAVRAALDAILDELGILPPPPGPEIRPQGVLAVEAADQARQAQTGPVTDSARHYAERLRAEPGKAPADGHTGWECDAGASLLVGAETPGPGKLGTHHGTIYACAAHRTAAVDRITGAGYDADPQPAPPGHRWNPWPCGHVTAYDAAALTALTAAQPAPGPGGAGA